MAHTSGNGQGVCFLAPGEMRLGDGWHGQVLGAKCSGHAAANAELRRPGNSAFGKEPEPARADLGVISSFGTMRDPHG